jgi:hypothetical protein
MPIALHPHAAVDFTLKADRALPEAERPVFRLRFQTGLEYERLNELYRQAQTVEAAERVPVLGQIAAAGVIGWRAMPDPYSTYSPEAMGKLFSESLTALEQWELAAAVLDEPMAKERDLKNSVSPSPTVSADSAGAVAAAGPNPTAPTAPPSPSL